MKKQYYYFKMLRVRDWIKGYFLIPFAGAFVAHASFEKIFFIGIIYFCVTAYSFVINNYFDTEIDRRHKGKIESNKNPLAQDLVTKRGTKMLLGILILIPLISATQINFTGFIFVLLSILASTLYSVKYLRLKERPIIDIITHGLMFGFFPFLAGVTLAGGNLNLLAVLMGSLLFIVTANELLAHQIGDYKDDLGNTKTTAIKIGLKTSYACLISLFAILLLSFGLIVKYFILESQFYWLSIFFLFWIPVNYIIKTKKISLVYLFDRKL